MTIDQPGRKALPFIQPALEPYWAGALRGQLLLQRCQSCGTYRHPASDICPQCLASEHAWAAVSGRGTVYSFVIVRQALDRVWEADVPYCVAIVALEEGPHVLSNITGVAMENVAVGLAVHVYFDQVSDTVALPKFTT